LIQGKQTKLEKELERAVAVFQAAKYERDAEHGEQGAELMIVRIRAQVRAIPQADSAIPDSITTESRCTRIVTHGSGKPTSGNSINEAGARKTETLDAPRYGKHKSRRRERGSKLGLEACLFLD
jgi:hypothetical protein